MMSKSARDHEYAAEEGREDRHGEMTGAISVNMVLSMPPVCIWAIFIGPMIFDSLWPTLVIALAMGLVLPLVFRPLSRRLWVRFSNLSES